MSGPATPQLLRRLAPGIHRLRPRYATRAVLHDAEGGLIDDGLVLYFPAPHSATGEDVAEFHLHGSPLIAQTVIETALAYGARLAGPGEFTRRAFLAGKLDLSAATAVADLIDAESRSGIRAAAARLGGTITEIVQTATHALRELLEELAAAIDFPDEVPDPARPDVHERLTRVVTQLTQLLQRSQHAPLLREGATVAIVGPPNAGKSSLLNAFLGHERAMVSTLAGTTRDTIEERVELDGVVVQLIDTAGIRAEADELEAAGIARTHAALDRARLALVVVDGSQQLDIETQNLLTKTRAYERVVLFNKSDIGDAGYRMRDTAEADALHGSIRDTATVDRIAAALRERLVGAHARIDLERPMLAHTREIDAARAGLQFLACALATLDAGEPLDFLVGDLNSSIAELGKITGATVSEEVLDQIFARFCIGK